MTDAAQIFPLLLCLDLFYFPSDQPILFMLPAFLFFPNLTVETCPLAPLILYYPTPGDKFAKYQTSFRQCSLNYGLLVRLNRAAAVFGRRWQVVGPGRFYFLDCLIMVYANVILGDLSILPESGLTGTKFQQLKGPGILAFSLCRSSMQFFLCGGFYFGSGSVEFCELWYFLGIVYLKASQEQFLQSRLQAYRIGIFEVYALIDSRYSIIIGNYIEQISQHTIAFI